MQPTTLVVVLSWLSLLLLASCDRDPSRSTAPVARPGVAEVLQQARELNARHQLIDALTRIEAFDAGASASEDPGDADAWRELRALQAALLVTLGRPLDAEPILEDLLRDDPENVDLRMRLARAKLARGAGVEAAEIFSSLELEDQTPVFVEYGRALAESGRTAEAKIRLAAGLIRDPWNNDGYFALGGILVRGEQRQLGEALLAHYHEGQEVYALEQRAREHEQQGEKAEAAHARARAEERRGNLHRAMLLYNRAIALERGLGAAYLDLARLSIFVARPGDAIRVLETLPPEAPVLVVLGQAEESRGDFVRAAEHYREALVKDPESIEAEEALARVDQRASAAETAGSPESLEAVRLGVIRETEKIGLSRSGPALLRLVDELERQGQRDDARRLALFALEATRPGVDVAYRVVELHDRPADVFFRLRAILRAGVSPLTSRLDRELEVLGVPSRGVIELLREAAARQTGAGPRSDD